MPETGGESPDLLRPGDADVRGIRFDGWMTDVTLRPWADDDLDLLRRANTPELMDQLGGAETDAQVRARHDRYLHLWHLGTARQFRIVIPGHPDGVGVVGYWQREWQGRQVLEAGWSVEAEYRGQGIASAAVREMLGYARGDGETLPVHAFPRVDNPASNAVCRNAGFRLLGEADFEVTPGRVLHTNDWVAELGTDLEPDADADADADDPA